MLLVEMLWASTLPAGSGVAWAVDGACGSEELIIITEDNSATVMCSKALRSSRAQTFGAIDVTFLRLQSLMRNPTSSAVREGSSEADLSPTHDITVHLDAVRHR